MNRHRTTIGEGAFVGTNALLEAPVTIGDRACIGSGSVVTGDMLIAALERDPSFMNRCGIPESGRM